MENSTNTVKTTYAVVLADIKANYMFPSAEYEEKFDALMASITKKSATKHKATPACEKPENIALYQLIKEFLAINGKATIAEILKGVDFGEVEVTSSKATSLLYPYIGTEIVNEKIKRKSYYSLAE